MDGGPAAPQKVNITERRIMAMELRKQGASYRMIASTLREYAQSGEVLGISQKYNESLAYSDVMTCLRELNKKRDELAEENRRLELERLDELWQVYYAKALNGDTFALQACMNIMNRRAQFLGLNAPVKVDQTTTTIQLTADDLAKARDKARSFEDQFMAGGDAAPPVEGSEV